MNVKQAPYSARGDGQADDTRALQRAIDEHDVVLLPKGTCSRVSCHGGGRWYSLFKAARMTIEGTSEPLRIYQSNPEWGNRPLMLIRNAADVTIYGLKEEGPRSIAILDSDRICVYGYGGVASARPGQSLLQVERTPNVRPVGLVDRVNLEGSPPTEWHMVAETPPNGPAVNTRPLDRIVLYRRGFEGP